MAGQRVLRPRAVGLHVDAREALAEELVGHDLVRGVERGTGLMDRSRALGVPAGALLARVLQPHRLAGELGEHRRIVRAVVGVVAAIGAGADHPDAVHVFGRHLERAGEAVAHEVRLLRAGVAGDAAVLDLDHGASRAHAGVRLERPLVFRFDHPRGGLERFGGVADRLLVHRFAHRRLADVVVERVLRRERRLDVRPLDLQRVVRLDRVPFLVGDHGEEVAFAHHARAGDALDRPLVDAHGRRARDRRADHAGMDHARDFHVGDERLLAEHLGRDVGALDRLADNSVVLWIFRLRLAGRVERVADLLVPVELDVEVPPADQLGVGNLLVAVECGAHDAVSDNELVGRCTEPCPQPSRPARGVLRRPRRASAARRSGCRSSLTRRPGSRWCGCPP